ncbi:hypothetical protein Pcinc_027409 [Petrolisthes cinctipes]|uniref:IGFBP-related protein 1 n=1 Tax=Petrolisthes cinctipes TaxID=88211 RepID=A0AAE1F523_PETCI|nr:hypothetical protein Pcinc_027409 [Petrolisthes cinctipes]
MPTLCERGTRKASEEGQQQDAGYAWVSFGVGLVRGELVAMERALLAIIAALLLVLVAGQEQGPECGVCDRSTCGDVTDCTGGVLLDECKCCKVCARNLGQRCDLTPATTNFGKCGEFLQCRPRTDIGDGVEATCVCEEEGPVCGSDGATYESLCLLLKAATDTDRSSELFVEMRGPCMATPVIKSSPVDMVRPLGSILVLDCEAMGFPVPEISWELSKLDGSSFKLPSDDSSFAVQVRGGPEPYMVTGWVQIMRITEESLGIYTCVATNSEGQAKASATVSLNKPAEREQASNSL